MAEARSPLGFFRPSSGFRVVRRRGLPHWLQAGTVCFLTWRTRDSIPKNVLESWLAERAEWLRRRGVSPDAPDWRARLSGLGKAQEAEFFRTFSDRWNDHLDACHGACELRRPELAALVAGSLRRFDGERYHLTDFVVMPNHVHVLAVFPEEAAMLAQCESWKRFTARGINRRLGRRGPFWQSDGFDHLVRSEERFWGVREYIAGNPRKAGLAVGEYVHYARSLEEL